MHLPRDILTAHHARTMKQNASQFRVDIQDSSWHTGLYHHYFDDVLSVTGCQITQGPIKVFLGSFLTADSPATLKDRGFASACRQTQLALLLVSKLLSPRKARETI